jgi:outer membrane protein assembly factor BamB
MILSGLTALTVALALAVPDTLAWLQWGGPRRNFTVEGSRIADRWPAGGPRRLWSRALGEGHSAVLVENGRLYTMYRQDGSEFVVALDAASGKTAWEYSYAESTSGLNLSQGVGPHSTPLILGDRIYALSSRVKLFALDKQTGKLAWAHDLVKEFRAEQDDRGYAPSPIAYRDTVIVLAGAPGAAVMAFHPRTGAVVWKGGDFPIAPGSPVLITVDGQDQLVVLGADEVFGMNPSNGAILWRHPHRTQYGLNISMPVWGPDNLLFVSSAYNNGTRALRLRQAAGKTTVKEEWFQNRMRVHFGNVIRLGDFVVGASGDFGPCPTVGIDLKSGTVLWQNREFARSSFVHADNKLIIMDEDGNLGLAIAGRDGLKVLAKAPVLSNVAWTVPTLAGTTLYARDRKNIVALSLGG